VAVITGTRAEYGLLRSTLDAIDHHPRLQLQLVVTGMHLLGKFGHTVGDIVRDGRRIAARVPMQKGSDAATDQALGLSRGIAGITRFLDRARTDIVLVLGDRIEALAGALAAVTTDRLLAHIHGGDIAPGDFDDPVRHAITKLAHLHLTATRTSHRRVLRLGEEARRVHLVGAPGLDDLLQLGRVRSGTRTRTGEALIVQHACGRSPAHERRVMNMILRAVADAGLQRAIIYPNTDRGHTGILQALEAHCTRSRGHEVNVWRSLPRETYLRKLLEVDVLVGNSSSGLLEAPVAGVPVVNIGPRQRGRERAGPGILDAEESYASIQRALARALRSRPRKTGRCPYGDGRAGRRIAALLARVDLSAAFRRKGLTY